MNNPISFDNTAIAFGHMSDSELRDAHFLFSSMQYGGLVKLGTRVTPWAIRAGLPVKGMIRKTIFRQFVGGENLEETAYVVRKMAESNVKVILDYGVEGKEGEVAFDHAAEEFIRVLRYAGSQQNIPFISIKVTGFARFSLLEKLDAAMHGTEGALLSRFNYALQQLAMDELTEWNRVHARMKRICLEAAATRVGVLVDAEESWIQDPVDALTMIMMADHNRQHVIVYNTIQLYRHDRLGFMIRSYESAAENGFLFGAKLVRGAYMEKERKRARQKGYETPIQKDKQATDTDYQEGLRFCMEHIDQISLIVATHNEESNLLAARLLQEKGLPMYHEHVHFSQLYGMSDHITFNLAAAGCRVSKYLPFGPLEDVIPYLMRRAQENTSVKGQTGRELGLIKKELQRRSGK